MSSEQPKLNNSEANNSTSGESQTAPQKTVMASQPAPATHTTDVDDTDESRAGGDVDFGQLLDQFEQEQATLEEGEVVRGTVVGLSERGVVIDFGYKSEGIVNPAEFTENGLLTVKAGDEVEVLVKSMETADGLPVLSRADAVRMKAWDDLEKGLSRRHQRQRTCHRSDQGRLARRHRRHRRVSAGLASRRSSGA